MRWSRTDVMAFACILGGAAVGGVVTAATLEGGDREPTVCVAVLEPEATRARADFVQTLLNEALSRELQIRQEREARLREQLARLGVEPGR